jgi:2-amino-4-hydroxy-6-hydroxymethyldihydropteridine diphosphokinase
MVILGLGSNIGEREAYLAAAVKKLSAVLADTRCSRVLESVALLPPDAPPEFNRPYLNMAVAGDTNLAPQTLLAAIKTIERELGRVERCNWGPREIDIDILAMDDTIINAPPLIIPHRELLNRDFVLLPLADVAPDWHYPLQSEYFGKTAAEIIAAKNYKLGKNLRDTGIIIHD